MAKMFIKKDGSVVRRYKWQPYDKSGSPFETWDEYVEWNEQQPCQNPACEKLRHGRSKYCRNCKTYAMMLGDPRWRPVKYPQYRKYSDMAMEVIRFNPENVVITEFTSKLNTMVEQSRQELPVEWASWFKHLHDVFNHRSHLHRRSPLKILADLAGYDMMYAETGNEIVKSVRMHYYTIGDIVLKNIKGKCRPRATGLRVGKFGRAIWQIFGIHFLKVSKATLSNHKLKQVRLKQVEEATLLLPEEVVKETR